MMDLDAFASLKEESCVWKDLHLPRFPPLYLNLFFET